MNKQLVSKLTGKYGKRTANIVESYLQGSTTQQIAARFHVRRSTVATTVGNLNRGYYDSVILG